MSADHLQFLKNKCIEDYKEATEEFGELLPLRLDFDVVLKVLRERRITPSTPIGMKDSLYDLKFALADCVIFAEKEREYKTENKKCRINARYNLKKLVFLCQTRKKLRRIKKNLTGGMNDDAAVLESSLPSDLVTNDIPGNFTRFNESKIHGFSNYLEKIKALLLLERPAHDGSIKAIGIVGMGGSGKTTLARMVCHAIEKRFSPMIWVQLPDEFNPENEDSRKTLVGEILGLSSSEYSEKSVGELLQELHRYLKEHKYLIVLDNVWHECDWYFNLHSELQTRDGSGTTSSSGSATFTHLTHGLPKGNGGAIILTSRLERVASCMVGNHNLHQISLLDAEACWSIFTDTTKAKDFLTEEHHEILSKMKDEIADQCDGLPLAAKTLAEVMSFEIGKERHWHDPTKYKLVILKLDVHTNKSLRRADEILRTLLGVHHVEIHFRGDDCVLWVLGEFNVQDVVRKLGKSWHTELIRG